MSIRSLVFMKVEDVVGVALIVTLEDCLIFLKLAHFEPQRYSIKPHQTYVLKMDFFITLAP